MSRLEKFVRYFGTMFALLGLFFIGNLILIGLLNFRTNSNQAYVQVGPIARELTEVGEGRFSMSQEGLQRLDWYQAFAFLIDEEGRVRWEYHMPRELPREYTRKDIASFSRWYLQDYPVYTLIVEEGIFVVGKPKGSVWRYTWIEFSDTLDAYITCLPVLLLGNLLLVVALPFWLIRRQNARGERERGAWIAGVSHDIRTPLSLTLGAALEIREESAEDPSVRRAALIEEQTLRIRDLIANLNMENKLSFGIGKWEREEIPLAAFLREILCDMLNRRPGERYTLEAEIDDGLERCVLRADRSLVRRLLENLIRNSITHNPNGCYVIVRLTKAGGLRRSQAVLSVEDDGVGVSPEQLRALRKPDRKGKLAEHGLGLRVVRQIASLYRWRLDFGPGEKGGLRCRIVLRVK